MQLDVSYTGFDTLSQVSLTSSFEPCLDPEAKREAEVLEQKQRRKERAEGIAASGGKKGGGKNSRGGGKKK